MKIFVTVGTQLAFDRLISAVDAWLAGHADMSAFAQIGPGAYRPKHMPFASYIDADAFQRNVDEASVIVAHAGMGSILSALAVGKPIIVMPRRAVFYEHRNDHQIATARSLMDRGRVTVAFDASQLSQQLDQIKTLATSAVVSRDASPRLIGALRDFIHQRREMAVPRIAASPSDSRSLEAARRPALAAAHQMPVGTAGVGDASLFAEQTAFRSLGGAGQQVPPVGETATGLREAGVSVLEEARPSPRLRAALTSRQPQARKLPRLRQLGGIVLLDGAIRRVTFARAVNRSLVELPIEQNRTVLAHWRDQILALRAHLEIDSLPCRIVVSHNAQPPQLHPVDEEAGLSIERDPADLRGTGGILHDIALDYDPDVTLLVANAAQILAGPLLDAALKVGEPECDVTVAACADGTPTSFALISCGALRALPGVGYIDLKEQGLAAMRKRHDVHVVRSQEPLGYSIRTASAYIAALRAHHRPTSRSPAVRRSEPFDERCLSRFSIIEIAASVEPSAVLHDAVVLAGSRVEGKAMIARSIVCAGTRVAAGRQVVDRLVSTGGERPLDGVHEQ